MKPIKFEFVPPFPLPASPLPEKTVIALLKLKAFVLAEPRRYDQSVYMTFTGVRNRKRNSTVEFQKPPCGTVCCLAGSAVIMEGFTPLKSNGMKVRLNPKSTKTTNLIDTAIEIIGLEEIEMDKLFAGEPRGNWCSKAVNAYHYAEGMLDHNSADNFLAFQARAEAAAMELDHLIATGNVGDASHSLGKPIAELDDQDQMEDSDE